MAVIYTDSGGTGYDPDTLRQAFASGRFTDPRDARVPDILAQYPSTSPTLPGGYDPIAQGPFKPPAGGWQIDPPNTPPPTFPTPPGRTAHTYAAAEGNGGSGSGSASGNGPGVQSPNMPAPGNDPNQVHGWYSSFLGRPGSPAEVQAWLASGLSLGEIQNQIANSPEAAAYALSTGFGTPVGAPAPAAGGGAPPANPATIYGNDPHASLLINEVLSRLAQLRQPIDTTAQDAYVKQALERVQQLGGAPFTDQQSQALLTKNMGPLTQARDSAKQQAAEEMARRGIGPTSGLFHQRLSEIDQAYERGVANVTNTLNIKGIDQATQNAQMQLSILNSIQDMTRQTRLDQEGLSSQLVPTAGVLTNFDDRRLQSLIQASSASDPNSVIASLTGVERLRQLGQGQANQESSANAYALAQMIYALMNGGLF